MQRIAGLELPVGVEMEPALPALILGPRIPGDAERLQPAVREGDQVLLQRVDTEGVADLEVFELAVRSVRGDEELAVAPEEARGHAAMGEAGVIEVTKHGVCRRLLHCQVVVRPAPEPRLGHVAGSADLAPHVGRHLASCRCLGRAVGAPGHERDASDQRAGDRSAADCQCHHDADACCLHSCSAGHLRLAAAEVCVEIWNR